ncbi:hypothetical protein SUDANB43_00554 [Streptomyces sp. enrichment culture]
MPDEMYRSAKRFRLCLNIRGQRLLPVRLLEIGTGCLILPASVYGNCAVAGVDEVAKKRNELVFASRVTGQQEGSTPYVP